MVPTLVLRERPAHPIRRAVRPVVPACQTEARKTIPILQRHPEAIKPELRRAMRRLTARVLAVMGLAWVSCRLPSSFSIFCAACRNGRRAIPPTPAMKRTMVPVAHRRAVMMTGPAGRACHRLNHLVSSLWRLAFPSRQSRSREAQVRHPPSRDLLVPPRLTAK